MNKLTMIVEIPKNSSNKYEYNAVSKKWELDRVLSGAMHYPEEYGFIPETLDYDGDPLDVICLTNYPTFPGCHIPIKVIGVLKMIDGGEEDDKLLAINEVDPRLSDINSLKDISKNKLDEISNFFLRYKELENKKVEIKGFQDNKAAAEVLKKCRELYNTHQELIKQGIDKKKLVELINRK